MLSEPKSCTRSSGLRVPVREALSGGSSENASYITPPSLLSPLRRPTFPSRYRHGHSSAEHRQTGSSSHDRILLVSVGVLFPRILGGRLPRPSGLAVIVVVVVVVVVV
jgi:hypothetical protein